MDEVKTVSEEQFEHDYVHNALISGLTSFRDAFQVTCRSSDQPHHQCGQCKACIVDARIHAAKEWWLQSGDLMKRRFLLALIQRLKPDILDQLAEILKPIVSAKDYTYTRNQFDRVPRTSTDHTNITDENDPIKRQEEGAQLIQWFSREDKYSQGSFILTILQWCDSYLIFTIALNIFSIQDMESEDEDHPNDFTGGSRLKIASALSIQSNAMTPMPVGAPILKRPKTTSSTSMRQKSAVSFASTTMDNLDSDTEQRTKTKHIPKYRDFIRQLPIYLAKSILSLLDKKTLKQCKNVSAYWKKLAMEVEDEAAMNNMLYDDMMLLQGSAALQCNPYYAHDTLVPVPDLFRVVNSERPERKKTSDDKVISTWRKMYEGSDIPTRLVLMEERNVYCGPYNVLLLKDDLNRHRTVHMSGESVVAIAYQDGRVRFIDMQSAQERPMMLIGHAASIRCMVVQEDKKRIFTGSYDLTVRCWSLETGRCLKLYQGHERTVTCLAVFLDLVAAGGNDNLCLVWRTKFTRPWRTFKHKHPVSAVAINDVMTLSGDVHGKIKVWHILTGQLLKAVIHRLGITGVKVDKWHIASSSHDYYASVWTCQGTLNKPLITFRHPKEVLSLEFLYLRLITGCADGKIRIWNALNGHCLRVMRGNSVSDPVIGLIATSNRLLINTQSNLLLMNFEPIKFDYTLNEDRAPVAKTPTPPLSAASSVKRKRSSIKSRQSTILKAIEQSEVIEKKKNQEGKVLFDNEKLDLDMSLEETKELLKRQIRGGVDEKRKLVPEEFRLIQQSPFYRADQSQDDTVYAEHRHAPVNMANRPPSSPSRFDLKTRIFRSQSHSLFSEFLTPPSTANAPPPPPPPQSAAQPIRPEPPSTVTIPRPKSPVSLFEVVHRPPSQSQPRLLQRQHTAPLLSFKSSSFVEEKSSMPASRPSRPETVPSTPTTYQVKRGGKIYKVVVGYVSPFTSPLQRNDLHLKTEGEIEGIVKQIRQQQQQQRLIDGTNSQRKTALRSVQTAWK